MCLCPVSLNFPLSTFKKKVAGESDSVPLVPVFLRPGSEFHLATTREEATSVVMVGPGTGVAPFRAYLQHLHHLSEAGHPIPTTTLYFGCRKLDWDFLFAEELQNFHQSRTLGDLRVALSREQTGPAWYCGKYVQDLMLEDASSLYRLLTTPNMSQLVVCGFVSLFVCLRRFPFVSPFCVSCPFFRLRAWFCHCTVLVPCEEANVSSAVGANPPCPPTPQRCREHGKGCSAHLEAHHHGGGRQEWR